MTWQSNLHPFFREKIKTLLALAEKAGLEADVFQGFRSVEEQNELFAQGRTKPGKIVTKARGGYSWHNFGIAVDIVFKKGGKWSWSEEHNWPLLGDLGKGIGLDWGGDWKRFRDRPHFQWKTNLTLNKARELYKNGGLEKVWENL